MLHHSESGMFKEMTNELLNTVCDRHNYNKSQNEEAGEIKWHKQQYFNTQTTHSLLTATVRWGGTTVSTSLTELYWGSTEVGIQREYFNYCAYARNMTAQGSRVLEMQRRHDKRLQYQAGWKAGRSETRGSQDVHVAVLQLVRPGRLSLSVHGGDLHLGSFEVGRVLCQPSGLSLHHLHRGRLLGSLIGLQSKPRWREKDKEAVSQAI